MIHLLSTHVDFERVIARCSSGISGYIKCNVSDESCTEESCTEESCPEESCPYKSTTKTNDNCCAEVNTSTPLFSNFRLPITYLDTKSVHKLSTVVASDLELAESTDSLPMYDHLFLPKHEFAKQMIQQWKRNFTTDVAFLKDSQRIIENAPIYLKNMEDSKMEKYAVDCTKMMEIWKDVKEDSSFLEKYSYMEWNMLKHLNKSSTFLQCLSILNIVSPVMSLLIPIIFLVFPFVILKIQGIPISFSVYMDLLKDIAKNHFIGKTLFSMQSFSWDKMGYVLLTGFLYAVQMYQNVGACMRFYRNLRKVTEHICHLRQYLQYSISSMENFVEMNQTCVSYGPFCRDISHHCSHLKTYYASILSIRPFALNVAKFSEMGYMMKCFYEIHTNVDYENALRYSFGFEGYINNMLGLHENLSLKNVSFALFDSAKSTHMKEQSYPPHAQNSQNLQIDQVKNSCKFDKNMIITGPNASGKTTLLKTTTINIIFSQQVGCGYYKSCALNPYTHIHSYLNIPDTSGRDSLFQAESRRCKEIIDIIRENPDDLGCRHYCIFDELYSGTNPDEAAKAAFSFLSYLSKSNNVDFILTTHYTSICKKLQKRAKRICNYKMDVDVLENGKFKYTYRLKKGISKIQGAKQILSEMNYPTEILDNFDK
jgi:hypothetical protein